MRMVFYSADAPDGQVVDWPVVPRRDELIQITSDAGDVLLTVDEVVYVADADGKLSGVAVWLSHG